MRILLLAHSFNSLSQRLYAELRERGHALSVELDINDSVSCEAVELYAPDIVLAPFLKRPIPAAIWRTRPCLIVHPGVIGDRGPSALDWAVLEQEHRWGVTVLQAQAEMDAGPVWASAEFPMREATKSSLYQHEVADAASAAVLRAVAGVQFGACAPRSVRPGDRWVRGRERPLCRGRDRRIDWQREDTATVLRKIRSADGFPGVPDELFGRPVRLFDAHPAGDLEGTPGTMLARGGGALARATCDGAVWIGHVRDDSPRAAAPAPRSLKLPAQVLFAAECAALPVADGYTPIRYTERGAVGVLEFEFYNGAMSTAQCQALRGAYAQALRRPTRVLVLAGGRDYWSNGIHLGMIEAAESPAEESWRNSNAIDDLVRDIILTTDRWVVSALRGSAGAGGVFAALAADEVWAAAGCVLNPHYRDLGNLYGSEYWTYLLPRRIGPERAAQLVHRRLPMGAAEARRSGLLERVLPALDAAPLETIFSWAQELAQDRAFGARIAAKRSRRAADEAAKPLQHYRAEELARMYRNFFGFDPSYHVARYNFIHQVPKSRTPLHLALHRAEHRGARRLQRPPAGATDEEREHV